MKSIIFFDPFYPIISKHLPLIYIFLISTYTRNSKNMVNSLILECIRCDQWISSWSQEMFYFCFKHVQFNNIPPNFLCSLERPHPWFRTNKQIYNLNFPECCFSQNMACYMIPFLPSLSEWSYLLGSFCHWPMVALKNRRFALFFCFLALCTICDWAFGLMWLYVRWCFVGINWFVKKIYPCFAKL